MTAYTLVHTVLSLIALVSGLEVLLALIQGRKAWAEATLVYLATAVATSVTGFGFPFVRILPSHIVGGLSLLLLGAAVYARYVPRPGGVWRASYAAGISGSVYLLVFVAIAQAFSKITALKALAPTLKEWPFVAAQSAVLALFAVATLLAVRSSKRAPPTAVR